MGHLVGGTSTYSKGRFLGNDLYPGVALDGDGPFVFTEHGQMLDFTCALGPVILGYRRQMGTDLPPSLPLPTKVEEEVAELLCTAVGAEKVRFFKNGSDALEIAVRIARAATGRQGLATNSYHGFHSDLVKATPGKCYGVPLHQWSYPIVFNCQRELHAILDKNWDELAAVVAEPFVPGQKEYDWDRISHKCQDRGVKLIFDEVVTGFRARFGSAVPTVQPDLACFGKAIANGSPLSALVGRAELIEMLKENVFGSSTFGGETTALVACKETLTELSSQPESYLEMGRLGKLLGRVLSEVVNGWWWRWQIKLTEEDHRKFVEELARRGVLVGRDFFLTTSHRERHILQAIGAIVAAREELGV